MEDFLRRVPLFSDLPESDLERLSGVIEEIHLAKGEELFAQGSRGDKAYVIKEGELEILRESEGRNVLLAVRNAGEVIGEISLLQEVPRTASVRARTDTVLFSLSQEDLDDLLNSSPTAARALLHTITSRLQSTETMLRQSEKIAQLGTLTAGVAHELNNPAAAVQRGTGQLKEAIGKLENSLTGIDALGLSAEKEGKLNALVENVRSSAGEFVELDSLTRSDREYEIEVWLNGHQVQDAWEIAPAFVTMGLVQADLTERFSGFSDEELGSIAALLTAQHSVYSLMEEVEQGAKQISQIVKALKTYAYLDQAPVQMIDVHEGLDNTLVMLRGEMKGIEVRRDYAEDLPRIQAYGSELNQVWTNIIDNAIDALEGAENSPGEILIRTRAEGEWVVVQIQDNGPGIPPEIQSKVFEPFFTTKDVGKGTGLGLDISYNIVVQKHRGDIRMTSEPGNTCFEIWLPTDFEKVESGEITVPGMEMINDEIKRKILTSSHNVAVVGMSTRPNVPAHTVPVFLHSKGYNIIPVRPDGQEVLGMQSYPDLASVPDPIDVVLVFRRSEDVPVVVHQAVAVGAKVVWMQEGIVNEAAAAVARNAGLQVVMDTCMRKEYRRLIESS